MEIRRLGMDTDRYRVVERTLDRPAISVTVEVVHHKSFVRFVKVYSKQGEAKLSNFDLRAIMEVIERGNYRLVEQTDVFEKSH